MLILGMDGFSRNIYSNSVHKGKEMRNGPGRRGNLSDPPGGVWFTPSPACGHG